MSDRPVDIMTDHVALKIAKDPKVEPDAEAIEAADLRTARHHAATSVEFLTFGLPAGNAPGGPVSVQVARRDDSRKSIQILNNTSTIQISNRRIEHLAGMFNAQGFLLNGSIAGVATMDSSYTAPLVLATSDEVWITSIGTSLSATSVSVVIERYSDIGI